MKVTTSPDAVCEMLSDSSDFDEKLVETMLGSMARVPLIAPEWELTSRIVIPVVTPNDPSTVLLLNTVAN